MRHKTYHSRAIRVIAFLTTFVFLVSSTSGAQPDTHLREAWNSFPRASISTSEVNVPQELGSIQSRFEASAASPLVFVIQDAHAIPDAQKSIQGLIDYFQKKYRVDLVALEGAQSKLDTQFFRSFPDKKLLKKIFQEYQSMGELSGGTAAAIFNESPAVYQGIEDWILYEEGISLYQKAMSRETEILERIEAKKQRNKEAKKRIYSKELLEVDHAVESFYENHANLLGLLKVLSKTKKLETGSEIELLAQDFARPHRIDGALETEVNRMAEEVRKALVTVQVPPLRSPYPNVQKPGTVHHFHLIRGGVSERLQALSRERQTTPPYPLPLRGRGDFSLSLAEQMERVGVRVEKRFQEDLLELNRQSQAFRTSKLSPESFAFFLRSLAEKHQMRINVSKTLNQSMEHEKRLSEIQGTRLFDELETYIQSVKESLFRNNQERELDQENHELKLLNRLAKLELTRKEWQELGSWEARELGGLGKADISFPVSQPPSFLALFFSHFAFYRNAERREDAMFRNLLESSKLEVSRLPDGQGSSKSIPSSNLQPPTSKSLLIAGGFHTEGFTERLKNENISFVLIQPRINSIPEETNYRKHMAGDVSWKNYFKIENGRVNLYEAFVRAARDRLLGVRKLGSWEAGKDISAFPQSPSAPASQPSQLKLWRDQIIRDLAEKGQITKTHQYTRFIDEVTQEDIQREERNQWMAHIERFIQGLERLEVDKQLTKENVLKLLQPAAMPDMTSSAANPAASLPASFFGLPPRTGESRAEVREEEQSAASPRDPIITNLEQKIQDTQANLAGLNQRLEEARRAVAVAEANVTNLEERLKKIEESQAAFAEAVARLVERQKAFGEAQNSVTTQEAELQKAALAVEGAENIVKDGEKRLKTFEGWLEQQIPSYAEGSRERLGRLIKKQQNRLAKARQSRDAYMDAEAQASKAEERLRQELVLAERSLTEALKAVEANREQLEQIHSLGQAESGREMVQALEDQRVELSRQLNEARQRRETAQEKLSALEGEAEVMMKAYNDRLAKLQERLKKQLEQTSPPSAIEPTSPAETGQIPEAPTGAPQLPAAIHEALALELGNKTPAAAPKEGGKIAKYLTEGLVSEQGVIEAIKRAKELNNVPASRVLEVAVLNHLPVPAAAEAMMLAQIEHSNVESVMRWMKRVAMVNMGRDDTRNWAQFEAWWAELSESTREDKVDEATKVVSQFVEFRNEYAQSSNTDILTVAKMLELYRLVRSADEVEHIYHVIFDVPEQRWELNKGDIYKYRYYRIKSAFEGGNQSIDYSDFLESSPAQSRSEVRTGGGVNQTFEKARTDETALRVKPDYMLTEQIPHLGKKMPTIPADVSSEHFLGVSPDLGMNVLRKPPADGETYKARIEEDVWDEARGSLKDGKDGTYAFLRLDKIPGFRQGLITGFHPSSNIPHLINLLKTMVNPDVAYEINVGGNLRRPLWIEKNVVTIDMDLLAQDHDVLTAMVRYAIHHMQTSNRIDSPNLADRELIAYFEDATWLLFHENDLGLTLKGMLSLKKKGWQVDAFIKYLTEIRKLSKQKHVVYFLDLDHKSRDNTFKLMRLPRDLWEEVRDHKMKFGPRIYLNDAYNAGQKYRRALLNAFIVNDNYLAANLLKEAGWKLNPESLKKLITQQLVAPNVDEILYAAEISGRSYSNVAQLFRSNPAFLKVVRILGWPAFFPLLLFYPGEELSSVMKGDRNSSMTRTLMLQEGGEFNYRHNAISAHYFFYALLSSMPFGAIKESLTASEKLGLFVIIHEKLYGGPRFPNNTEAETQALVDVLTAETLLSHLEWTPRRVLENPVLVQRLGDLLSRISSLRASRATDLLTQPFIKKLVPDVQSQARIERALDQLIFSVFSKWGYVLGAYASEHDFARLEAILRAFKTAIGDSLVQIQDQAATEGGRTFVSFLRLKESIGDTTGSETVDAAILKTIQKSPSAVFDVPLESFDERFILERRAYRSAVLGKNPVLIQQIGRRLVEEIGRPQIRRNLYDYIFFFLASAAESEEAQTLANRSIQKGLLEESNLEVRTNREKKFERVLSQVSSPKRIELLTEAARALPDVMFTTRVPILKHFIVNNIPPAAAADLLKGKTIEDAGELLRGASSKQVQAVASEMRESFRVNDILYRETYERAIRGLPLIIANKKEGGTLPNYFAVLGVPRNADKAVVKASYKKLAFAYHPDRFQHEGAEAAKKTEEIFSRIAVAYENLSDQEKRSTYNRLIPNKAYLYPEKAWFENLPPVSRSEMRIIEKEEMAREVVSILLLLIWKVDTQRKEDVVAENVVETLKVMRAAEFVVMVRSEARALLNEIEENQKAPSAVSVDKALAEKAVAHFTKALAAEEVSNNLAVAFDTKVNQNLLDALNEMKGRIGIAFFKSEMAKGGLSRKVLKELSFKFEFVGDLGKYRPSQVHTVQNPKAVPVVNDDLLANYLRKNEALFGVGVNRAGIEGEPYLEVVEKVVQIVSGLVVAEFLAARGLSPSALRNRAVLQEIQAELLRRLFEDQALPGIIAFRNGNLVVSRPLLQKFVTEYFARAEIRKAA